jgi:hypothetical protein
MLVVALTIWLLLLLVAVAFCRAAAGADRRYVASVSYPSRSGSVGAGAGSPRVAGVSSPGSYDDRELALVEPRIHAAGPDKLVVGASLDDLAAIEHEDLVGGEDRGDTVRDHERGATVG